MPHVIPGFAQIRDDLLRDLKSLRPTADTSVDSDYYVRYSSIASAIEGLYEHQAWVVKQIFPDTADSEYLALHARVRGLSHKPAVASRGQFAVRGSPGSAAAAGLAVKIGDRQYVTTEPGAIGADGTGRIAAMALVAGVAGNAPAGTSGTLMAPPPGIATEVSVVTMTGGVDKETDAELLLRLLELIRRPPAGGNRYDYRRWAMEVPGVSAAYVYPLRRGLGTVDVVITSGGALPSAETIARVQAHIDDVRPVTAKNSLVLAPTEKVVAVDTAVKLDGITDAGAKAQIESALGFYFGALIPGETAYRSRMEALISDIPGVIDRSLSTPASNVVPVVDATKVEWLRLGAVSVRKMP